MKKTRISEGIQVTLVAMLVFLLYLIALIFPDSWWGLHYPAFLGGGKGMFIVLFAVGFALYGTKYSFWEGMAKRDSGIIKWVGIIGCTIVAGIFFHAMPIAKDVYGDALKIIPSPDFIISEFADQNKELLTSFDFTNLKLGTDTTVSLVIWMSYKYQIELQDAFRILGTISGMGYVFFTLATLFKIARNNQQRLLFSLMVVGSPIVLNFCGHIEIYAPILFVLSAFWYGLICFVNKPTWISGVVTLFLCFLNLKFHISGGITFLIFAVAVVCVYLKSKQKEPTWRNLGATVLIAFFSLGFVVYAFVTKSIFGPRNYTEENLTDAIFLPIKSSDSAPLDRYNLFSWNHFFDYFNMAFLWSAIALIIVAIVLIFKRKNIRWNTPLVLISGLGFVFYLVVFFVLNPLLGMTTDWDLMSIPAISLMVFAGALVVCDESTEKEEISDEKRSFTSYLIAPAAGLFIIGLTGVFVNADLETESDRVISYGKYSYKTYWIGASTPISEGIFMKEESEEQYAALDRAIQELEPYAVHGNDIQYAALLHKMGAYHQNVKSDINEAHKWYLRSEKADKRLILNIESLTFTHFVRGEFDDANRHVANLIFNKHPNEMKALRMGIHIALEAEEYETSKKYCQQLLKVNPNDNFIREILQLLNTSEDKSQIKFRFRQS